MRKTGTQAEEQVMAERPLEILSGIKVLSFTQFLFGPAAVQYLSDLGADVVKIESPGSGAFERTWAGGDAFVNGVSVFYLLAHRNVRSLTLNLKSPEGKAIAERLISEADVLVQNFRPGVMERFGLSYEDAREINPRIIYASASGYGEDSPYRHLPGQDLLVQAVSGLMALNGRASDMPTPMGAAVVDQHSAALLAMGVLAALLHRERTGEGQKVEVPMVRGALDLQMEPLVYFMNGGRVERSEEPLGSAFHPAPYGVYRTTDGHIAMSLSPIRAVREALGGVPELAAYEDPSLALEKREQIRAAIAPHVATLSTSQALEVLQSHGVWCTRVNSSEEALSDPIVSFLDPILEVDHPEAGRIRLLKHPVSYGAGEPAMRRLPPAVGENSEEILEELGYGAAEIIRFRASGVI
jgi:crotonobetainyl-CoA:carnitine CoA-transferase CaiB-like acyl-CoA transferase